MHFLVNVVLVHAVTTDRIILTGFVKKHV